MKQLALVLVAALSLACSPPSAEDLVREIIQQRNNYEATLQSWIEREDGTLYLDVLVVNNNLEASLRTLTVMVEQRDADGNVLSETRVPMAVSELTPGMGQSVGLTVPSPQPALDGLWLFVEPNPGADTWAEFPELDAVRPRV